jgi:peptidoglycan/LPS O-acetylase OafA/YrhL
MATPEPTPAAPVPARAADPVGSLLRGHVPVLDGVRGLAILLLLMHQLVLPSRIASPPVRLFELTLQVGWAGVQLFFVLSGFLITGILLDTRAREGYFRSFYVRRVLRIFPLYYLLLVTLAVVLPRLVAAVPEPFRTDPRQIALYWVYLPNWSHGGPDALGHCWSLAVEEQFYLVWPLVVRLLDARLLDARRLLRTSLGLAVLSLAVRIAMRARGVDPDAVYAHTLARMDALVIGAAGAVLLRDAAAVQWLRPRLGRGLAVAAGALAVTALVTKGLPRTGLITQTLGYSLLAIVFALLVARAVVQQADGGSRLSRALSWRPLRELGKYSYAIYILQLPMHLLVSRVLLADVVDFRSDGRYLGVQIAYSLGMLGGLFLLGVISYHLFEKRFLALKSRFSVR